MDIVDSNAQALQHIRRVQTLLADVANRLMARAIRHDSSKLCEPEASVFAKVTEQLKGLTYGSEEYKACLAEMKPALDHHYAYNSHHPEHWTGGITDMSLLDLIEMFVDWKAATERHDNGDLAKSIVINKTRFGYGDELESIFNRTLLELFPKSREPWHCFGCGAGGMQGNFCEMCGAGKHDYECKPEPTQPQRAEAGEIK